MPVTPGSVSNFLDGARWLVASTPPGLVTDPRELPGSGASFSEAVVPGTVASVRESTDRTNPDALDWWFTTAVTVPDGVATVLTFDGIATRATVWVDGVVAARSRSMFVPVTAAIPASSGAEVTIAVHIESLDAHLKKRRPRGRWRSSLIAQQGLRHERTTLLGRAPVYGSIPVPVGLWRPVTLAPQNRVHDVRVHAGLDGATGIVRLRARSNGARAATLRIGDVEWPVPVGDSDIDVSVTVDDVVPWWPHTHGEPTLYPWSLDVDGVRVRDGALGFRAVELRRVGPAVTLSVNGVRVFARGGCWVPPDPIRLWIDEPAMRAELERVRDAGLNMIRVVGTLVYEQPEFWSLCAELGIMVWQDVMNATTDPPDDDEFVHLVEGELAALTSLVGGNPALAVVSGGSETQQQPTMLGLPSENQHMSLLETVIPDHLARELPGTPYVTSSPSSTSGALHTHVGDGIAHYFGVGGYLRPLSDVRTARVRFAAECLAFAVPPERRAVERMFGSSNVAGHQPDWKAAVPRDRGSSWDFEDVRDHYVREIFGVDPHLVRRDDADLYLDYGRAAVCEAVTASYMHWRRAESECSGALVLTLRDLVPGAGWGFEDSTGAPKAPWYSLARLSAPVSVFLVDDGLDGLTAELVCDAADPVVGALRVTLYGAAAGSAEIRDVPVELAPRSAQSMSVDSIVGSFADVNHAYRFGGQTYAAVTAELVDDTGTTRAEATHLVGARHGRQNDIGLTAAAVEVESGVWALTVTTTWAAQYVCIDVDGLEPSDSWFHLAPGAQRTITLTGAKGTPSGHVRALNSIARAHITWRRID